MSSTGNSLMAVFGRPPSRRSHRPPRPQAVGRVPAEPERQLTAVLFVDIVEATQRAVLLGDRAWAELLERYHQLVRASLERHPGWLMDTAGDGFFAIFDETMDAIRCALDIRTSVQQLGLELRSGVHLGHCWKADEKCAGADVHVGARLAGSARPGEVLLSEEAAEEARRTGLALTDRGVRSLKGLPGTRRVFAVSSAESPNAGRCCDEHGHGKARDDPRSRRDASARA